MDVLWSVEYWSNELERVSQEVRPLAVKLCKAPIPELTYEERFVLREALQQYMTFSKLLKEDLDRHNTPPVPFYKKLFRK